MPKVCSAFHIAHFKREAKRSNEKREGAQKSGMAGCNAAKRGGTKGSRLPCLTLRWLLPNTSQGGGPHNTRYLLRQDQLPETGCS